MVKIDINVKICTLLSCLFCFFTISFSVLMSILQKRILTFDFSNIDIGKEFLVMNYTMIYIYSIFLALFNLILFIFLIRENEKMLIKVIYTNLKWFFFLTQICFGFLFLIGIIWDASNWTWILSASVNMATTVLLAFYFQDIKQKKNMQRETFSIYVYLSTLFAFISYVTFYNFSIILINNLDDSSRPFYTTIIQITTNLFQTILSIVLLTYFKDCFFALGSLYIELALIIHNEKMKINNNMMATISFCFILFISTLVILIKYKKKAFGYEEINEIIDKEEEFKEEVY